MFDGAAESPAVTTMLGASGACPEIRLNGKVWKVGHPTQRAKATLETLAVAQAVAEATALKDVLPAEQYAQLFKQITDNIGAKHYKTWGDGWREIVWGPQSTHLFFLSLLRENHPDATEEDAQALMDGAAEQVAAALVQVIPPFVSLLLDARKGMTPEQRRHVMGVVRERLETLDPSLKPPAPIPSTSVPSSSNGAKPSRKNRGAGTPIKAPA